MVQAVYTSFFEESISIDYFIIMLTSEQILGEKDGIKINESDIGLLL